MQKTYISRSMDFSFVYPVVGLAPVFEHKCRGRSPLTALLFQAWLYERPTPTSAREVAQGANPLPQGAHTVRRYSSRTERSRSDPASYRRRPSPWHHQHAGMTFFRST